MAPRYVLDTNICIYIRQKKPPAVLRRFEKLTVGDAAISVVTYGELLYGAVKSPERSSRLRQLGNEAATQREVTKGWLRDGISAHVVLLIGGRSRVAIWDARPT